MTDIVAETIKTYDEEGLDPKQGVELLELIDAYTRGDSLDEVEVHGIMAAIGADTEEEIPPYRFQEADDRWQWRFGNRRYEKEPELTYEHQENGDTISLFLGYSEHYPAEWKYPDDEAAEPDTGRLTQIAAGIGHLYGQVSGLCRRLCDVMERQETLQYQAVYRGDLHELRQELEKTHETLPGDNDGYRVSGGEVWFSDDNEHVTLAIDEGQDEQDLPMTDYLDDLTLVGHQMLGNGSYIRGYPIIDRPLVGIQERSIEEEAEE